MIDYMADDTFLISALAVSFLLACKFLLRTIRQYNKNHPPSPPSLPIIGHLHLFKLPLHRSLHKLSQKYGPTISLRLGTRRVLVISSLSAAEECFTKNDIVFANRPDLTIYKYVAYNCTTPATASYGDHWRNLRRISAVEIFSSDRLNGFLSTRRDEIKIFLNKLYRVSRDDFAKVELKPILMELNFNIIMRMVAGKRYYGDDVGGKEAEQFRQLITEIFEYGGASYLGDFLPMLRWIDHQGFVKRVKGLGKRADMFLQGLIDEHRVVEKGNSESKTTMIGHLLLLQQTEPENYSDQIIKALILDIVLAGTETSVVTLEWTISSLLNHPEILEKAQKELDTQIGHEKFIDESNISKLPYLQSIITETLRLYPAGPLLAPHLSSQECNVGGYHVEPNTMLLVNAWAINRDPELWDDADKFKPERFKSITSQGGTSAVGYKLMTFGMGRRSCPGAGLANHVLGFALGSMIHCFEWKRVSDREIDMSEGVGLSMPKAKTLQAMCKARSFTNEVLSAL